eukprot:CAMPEP_0172047730 /NCGR_PEP_ID=MMETSP1043-20130122/1156_1 /TAXON_ID=464988 /ORGANISM="Hemiselmis andersenii, Strain CCMP441" /LENGTH=110 /DNA_ID=CAMNT_0012706587 /DNA_START=374 /DNA_END=704 /DNA_ORIENTATION=+
MSCPTQTEAMLQAGDWSASLTIPPSKSLVISEPLLVFCSRLRSHHPLPPSPPPQVSLPASPAPPSPLLAASSASFPPQSPHVSQAQSQQPRHSPPPRVPRSPPFASQPRS